MLSLENQALRAHMLTTADCLTTIMMPWVLVMTLLAAQLTGDVM